MYKLRIGTGTCCFVVLEYRTLTEVSEVLYSLFNSTTAVDVDIWKEEREDTCLNNLKSDT